MSYTEIAKKLKEVGSCIEIEIANCVTCSMSNGLNKPKDFETICLFTSYVWDKVDKGYTQLLTDIIIELYNNGTITLEQMEKQDYDTAREVMSEFYNRYYE